MTDIKEAVSYLKKHGVEAIEEKSELVIPCSSPKEIFGLLSKVRELFNEIDYKKTWVIDPYYFMKHTDDLKGDYYESYTD